MRRIAALTVAAMLIVSIAVAAVLALGDVGEAPTPSGPVALPSTPASSGSASEAPVVDALSFGERGSPSPIRDVGQSRLWYQDGAWWGVFLSADESGHRIFSLDARGEWSATSTVVDERPYAQLDVLWDGARLVVAGAGPQPLSRHALQVSRFSYDPASRTYRRDADFPVTLTGAGAEGVTVTRSSDGHLWISYRTDGAVVMDHTLGSDMAWRGPFVPEAAGGLVAEAAIASMGDHVALVWTRPLDDAVYIATHDVNRPADQWLAAPPVMLAGLDQGENEISLAADESPGATSLFVAVRAGLDDSESRRGADPQIVIVEFALDSEPEVHLFSRVEDQHAAPVLVIDGQARTLYVIAASPRVGGTIFVKQAPLDRIGFAGGRGAVLIEASPQYPRARDLTSTKQAVDARSGLLVAAADQESGSYVFGAIGLDPAAPHPSAGPGASAVPILEQTFDGLAVGTPVSGWLVDGDPPPPFVIANLTGADGSARLSGGAAPSRACARFNLQGADVLRVEADLLFNLPTDDELHLLQVRGDSGELASLRLRDSQLAYFDGGERVVTDLVLRPGRWYGATLTLDVASQTYTAEVRDVASDTSLLDERGLGWRSTESSTISRMCVELPAQDGLDLYVNNVRVTPGTTQGD